MPHSTSDESANAHSVTRGVGLKVTSNLHTGMEKFPDHIDSFVGQTSDTNLSPAKHINGHALPPNGERWQPQRGSVSSNYQSMKGRTPTAGRTHGRQKSLSDAIRTIRTRRGSVSANAHEIADALKAPVSPKLVVLCVIWYFSSALTNTSSKSILTAFPKPATLTVIQFAFVCGFCLFFSWLATIFPNLKNTIPSLRYGIRYPTREVIKTTLPLAAFQIGGHLLSSKATMKIPVSLVHTIKGLSPLFTVFAYRVIFDIRYPIATYLSLIPLTLGVMLACSAEFRGNIFGILYAFSAALIFVTQNIFSKRLFNEAAKAESDGQHLQSRKLDKLNLLCYSSGMAFLLTAPIWVWTEGIGLLGDLFYDGSLDLETHPDSFDHGRLALEFIFNGTFHFGQNIIAFILLSMVSPVTYSVASLIKRVFVVVVAIIWFQNPTTTLQAIGIVLTFFGLYLYDRTSDSNKADRKARMMDIKEEPLLPTSSSTVGGPVFESPISSNNLPAYTNGYGIPPIEDRKKSEETRRGRPRGASTSAWLPPGTRQEETWRPRELSVHEVRVT